MLGTEIVRVARSAGLEPLEVSRLGGVPFDAEKDSFSDLAQSLRLSEQDLVINCIGWIPQKASGDPTKDEARAQALNTFLPIQISDSRQERGFNWLQIGTDCVYSGERGGYSEADYPDPVSLYGRSKALGEKLSKNCILIRCSIVGPDKQSAAGLYEWFKGRAGSGVIKGYTNHKWNGVSTTAFARLTVGLFSLGQLRPMLHHWVPKGSLSKFELLESFAYFSGLDVEIIPCETRIALDRTLLTNDYSMNVKLWNLAGYEKVPSIRELVSELVSVDGGLGL